MNQSVGFFEKQGVHLVALAALLVLVEAAARIPETVSGSAWGVSSQILFWASIAAAISHQVYVWLCWRLELLGQHLSKSLGGHAFSVFAAGFGVLGSIRLLLVYVLAYANRDSLNLDPEVGKILALILLVPAAYLAYSLARYFGVGRAFGKDHFDPEFRNRPFVKQGIFRYTDNGMYVYGFLFFWVPAFWFCSMGTLVVAVFNHLYIWVHFYCTERPDIRRIYGNGAGGREFNPEVQQSSNSIKDRLR